ncbi:MAG: ATP-binding protein [Escherichia coli]
MPGYRSIQIHDTGIGIPERDRPGYSRPSVGRCRYFTPPGGTGLGLVISASVKEMGGFSFHSQPNRGSTFWFQSASSQPERHSGYAEHRRACRQTSGLCGSQRDGGAVYPGDAGRYAAGGYLQPYLLLAGGSAV